MDLWLKTILSHPRHGYLSSPRCPQTSQIHLIPPHSSCISPHTHFNISTNSGHVSSPLITVLMLVLLILLGMLAYPLLNVPALPIFQGTAQIEPSLFSQVIQFVLVIRALS